MELSVRNRELDFGNVCVCELECVCVHNNKKIKTKRNAQAFGRSKGIVPRLMMPLLNAYFVFRLRGMGLNYLGRIGIG